MIDDYKPITIADVAKALYPLKDIERPDADNAGDSINAPDVYDYLDENNQEKIDNARNITRQYIEQSGNRAIRELNKHGYNTSYGPDQYEPDRNSGQVQIGEWELDISDESPYSDD